ncbi:hypothetical protein CKAN_00787900 [Cinnamomum micranthum f. kanehirae]|uniref:Uncharacterized protein n=1 Tax=Cinnamomum micranthum f. kanehirae TaxID=337451 RepID=A0A443NLB0_9MAGN|nr:hypothetical protein CKAN_00787900 [Cinnamomum micranthum f. kanehirae]
MKGQEFLECIWIPDQETTDDNPVGKEILKLLSKKSSKGIKVKAPCRIQDSTVLSIGIATLGSIPCISHLNTIIWTRFHCA